MPYLLKYILKRTLLGVITLFIFLSVMFFAIQLMLPGDYVTQFALQMGPAEREALEKTLGLKQPIHLRYIRWVGNLLRFDLGTSYSGTPILQILKFRLPYSALLMLIGLSAAFFLGYSLGKWAGWQPRKWISDPIIVLGLLFYASFPPLVAFLTTYTLVPDVRGFIYIYPRSIFRWLTALDLSIVGLFQSTQPQHIFHDVKLIIVVIVSIGVLIGLLTNRHLRRTLHDVTWIRRLLIVFLIIDGILILRELGHSAKQALQATAFPVITFVLMIVGDVLLTTNTSMKDVLGHPFILTARAKGLPDQTVRNKHVARNAILPVLGRLAVLIPFMFSGIAIVEHIFGWPGIGDALWRAILDQDVPLFMGALFFIGVLTLLTQIALELLSLYLDPRLRGQASQPTIANKRLALSIQLSGFQAFSLSKLRLWLKRKRNNWAQKIKRMQSGWRIYIEEPKAVLGLVILLVLFLMALSHPILMNTIWPVGIYDPSTGIDYEVVNPAPPSIKHPLGTTATGLDVLSLLLASTRNSFTLGLTAGIVAACAGVILGLMSEYFRGNFELAFNQITNALLLLPAPIFMAFTGIVLIESGPVKLGIIYGVIAGLGPIAVVMKKYASQFVVKPYVEAAMISGGGAFHIISRHLIPQMIPMAIIQVLVTATGAVIVDGYLSYLGVTRYYINWGTMLFYTERLSEFILGKTLWRAILPPAICFSLFGLSFHLVSNGIHRVVDPQLRTIKSINCQD